MEHIDILNNKVTALEISVETNNNMTKEIHTALTGTYEKKGLINKVEKLKDNQDNCMNRRKNDSKEKKSLYFYIEKTLIASGLGYVIAKIKGIL